MKIKKPPNVFVGIIVVVFVVIIGSYFIVLWQSYLNTNLLNLSRENGLEKICANEADCNIFCKDNLGQCRAYCRDNPQNPLCQKPFSLEEPPRTPKINPPTAPLDQKKTLVPSPTFVVEQSPITTLKQTTTLKTNCINNPSPVFTNHITDMSKVSYVVPPPTMGAGPSLKTHSYIGTNRVNVPLYAPIAMVLKSGSHYVGGPYMFEFQTSCEVTVRFGHVTSPIDSIKNLLPVNPQSDSRTQELSPVGFAAGELIGYTTGTSQAGNWDFGVYNSTIANRYANDPNWNNSTTYTTAVCPFEYFAPNLKTEYVVKFGTLGGNPPHDESFCL